MYANRSYKFQEILQTHYCFITNVYVFLGQTPYIGMIGMVGKTMWTIMAGHVATVLCSEEEPGGTGGAATPISTESTTSLPVLRIELGFIEEIAMVGNTS